MQRFLGALRRRGYLTHYRAYDPVPGRWLSRDPLGEMMETSRSKPAGSIAETFGSTLAFARSSGTAPSGGTTYAPSATEIRIQLSLQALPLSAKLPQPKARSTYIAENAYDLESASNLYSYVRSDPISKSDPEGFQIKLLGPQGTRICGVICGGYGCRMDYGPNPSPSMLHFHIGPLASPYWGGHRPWYAPWCAY